jgi:hypothetical protein
MDDAALKREIDTDPAGRGYAQHVLDGNLVAVADLLNEPVVPGRRQVPVGDVLALARTRGLVPRIRQFAGVVPHFAPPAGVTPTTQLAALAAVDLFETPDRLVDLDLPEVATVLAALEQADLLTSRAPDGTVLVTGAANRAAINALGDTKYSRAELALGEPGIAPGHADMARALQGGAA